MMPYTEQYTPPDRIIQHAGVEVFHSYKDDNYDIPFRYWYVVGDSEQDTYGENFDIRRLATFAPEKTHEQVLREAIDAGLIA